MSGKPILAFARALQTNWFAAMSGGFSVPFASLAVFSGDKYQQVIWGLLAFSSIGFASYRLFASEHQKVLNLQERLGKSEQSDERDAGIGEAVGYICFREWGQNFLAAAGSQFASGAKEYDELLQACADGHVLIWGKRNNYGVHEPIPKEFWFKNRIDWFSLLRNEPTTEHASTSFNGDSYSALMTSRAAVERYWPPMGSSGPRALSALRISFGQDEAYTSTTGSSLYRIRRTLSFKIENIGTKALSNCRIIIESCNPRSGLTLPVPLREGITLAPADHTFIEFVRYGEAPEPDKSNHADSFVTLVGEDEKPLFDAGETVLVKLKATGIDTPAHTAQCRIWVNQTGRLEIQREWRG
jgi:hypothetical protein